MPHTRQRYLESLISNGLKFKGIVGVFGHRQVGKTTLLELLSGSYTTLDRASELSRAELNPDQYVKNLSKNLKNHPVAIDECQSAPTLFPALKEYVRAHKKPGIFLLSGSVRFSSLQQIRESLTGRILNYELLPFSISELAQNPLNTLPLRLMSMDFKKHSFNAIPDRKGLVNHKEAKKYLEFGGLPGICFVKNQRDRISLLESQISLILDRDLRLVTDTEIPLRQLRSLVQLLAENQNIPLSWADLKRKSRLSVPTLKKVLSGLEAIFFLRTIETEGDEVAPVLFLEDQGEASYLASYRNDSASDFARLAYAHLRIPFAYTVGVHTEVFQFRKHGGAYVPLAFRQKNKVIGFIFCSEESPSLSALKSGDSFRAAYKDSKVIYLHPHRNIEALNSDELCLPIECVF